MSAVAEIARRVSRRYERVWGLDVGSLLAVAWFGARQGEESWRRDGLDESRRAGYCGQAAAFAVRTALRDGEHDGSRRLRSGRAKMAALGEVDPVAQERQESAGLEVAEALDRIAQRYGLRDLLVVVAIDGEGRTTTEIAERLGVSKARVSQIHSRALAAARGE